EVRVDARTGYRVQEHCPAAEVRTEYFLQGTEPFASCPVESPWADERWADTSSYGRWQDTLRHRMDTIRPGDRTIFWRGDPADDDGPAQAGGPGRGGAARPEPGGPGDGDRTRPDDGGGRTDDPAGPADPGTRTLPRTVPQRGLPPRSPPPTPPGFPRPTDTIR